MHNHNIRPGESRPLSEIHHRHMSDPFGVDTHLEVSCLMYLVGALDKADQ